MQKVKVIVTNSDTRRLHTGVNVNKAENAKTKPYPNTHIFTIILIIQIKDIAQEKLCLLSFFYYFCYFFNTIKP